MQMTDFMERRNCYRSSPSRKEETKSLLKRSPEALLQDSFFMGSSVDNLFFPSIICGTKKNWFRDSPSGN